MRRVTRNPPKRTRNSYGGELADDELDLSSEYDLTKRKGGVRGKYLERYRSGTNLVFLSPDVAAHFRAAQSVNSALRTLIRTSKRST